MDTQNSNDGSDAAANAVAAVATAMSIDPDVIGQIKDSNGNIPPNLEEVLHHHHQHQQQDANEQKIAKELQDVKDGKHHHDIELLKGAEDVTSKNHPRIIPRTKLEHNNFLEPDLHMNIGIAPGYGSTNLPSNNVSNGTGAPQDAHVGQNMNNQPEFSGATVASECTRCKKPFASTVAGKVYKLCPHCRDLQRERSRRWQTKTKKKEGACRRCGQPISAENSQYVLCPSCRMALRTRKANRAAQGKCVHCSGPNDSINNEFKVCQRCRHNDKLRRSKLEAQGACNRCAKPLLPEDNSYKVCSRCRVRKKRLATGSQDIDDHSVKNLEAAQAAQVAATAAAAAAAANFSFSQFSQLPQLSHFPPEVQQHLQFQFQQRQQQQQQQAGQHQQHDAKQDDSHQQAQQGQQQQGTGNDNEQHYLSTENFVQQLQSAAASSFVANAALGSRIKDDGSKADGNNEKSSNDEQNNLFLNPEAEDIKLKK